MYGIVEGVESLANDVTRMPVTVSAEWHSTPVTTDPPRTAQHLEWRVTFLLRAPEPIYVAALLTHGGENVALSSTSRTSPRTWPR